MKILYVGDTHVTQDAIPEMRQLIQYIIGICKNNSCKTVCFLGDQFHTHATINLFVMAFWAETMDTLWRHGIDVIALVGNHDMPGKVDSKDHAMLIFKERPFVTVIDTPTVFMGLAFMPYFHDTGKFVEAARELYEIQRCSTLVCHQTFQGAMYENGFYASDGVDQELLPFNNIISGHIHSQSEIGKVHYVGSPRWRTVADANQSKALWLYQYRDDGVSAARSPFATSGVCTPIHHLKLEEGKDQPEIPQGAKVTLDLIGTEAWVRKKESEFEGTEYRLRSFITQQEAPQVKESEGLEVAFQKFVDSYKGPNASPPESLRAELKPYFSW